MANTTVTVQTADIGCPQTFNGDKAQAHCFRLAFDLFLYNNSTRYDTDEKKIGLFLQCMVGDVAGAWQEMILEKVTSDVDTKATNPNH